MILEYDVTGCVICTSNNVGYLDTKELSCKNCTKAVILLFNISNAMDNLYNGLNLDGQVIYHS